MKSYSITHANPGEEAARKCWSRVSAAIGSVGGIIGAVDIVESTPAQTVRDITVSASSVEHEEQIAAAVRAVPDVTVINVSDRTFLMHLGGKIEVHSAQASDRQPGRSFDGVHARCLPRVCTPGDQRGSRARSTT